jgi:hypothetical protein
MVLPFSNGCVYAGRSAPGMALTHALER